MKIKLYSTFRKKLLNFILDNDYDSHASKLGNIILPQPQFVADLAKSFKKLVVT